MQTILKPKDLYRFSNAGDPQVSPDGSRVVFVVSQADKKSDKNLSNIWIVDTSGGKPRRLTVSGKDGSPRWSPDGKRIASVSTRSGKSQIWIMETDGGEPWLLSTDQAVMGAPVWSPDGKFLVFTARDFTKDAAWTPYPGAPQWDGKRARQQADKMLSGRSQIEGDEGRNAQKGLVSDVKVITRFRYRFDGIGYLGDLRNHIFIAAVPESAPESALQSAPDSDLESAREWGGVKGSVRRLTWGDYDHDGPAFSPDGKYLVITAARCQDNGCHDHEHPNRLGKRSQNTDYTGGYCTNAGQDNIDCTGANCADADYVQKQDLWLLEVSTGRMVHLMDGLGPCGNVRWSPDGRNLAFIGNDRSHDNSTTNALWVLEVEGFIRDLESREGLSTPPPLSMKNAISITRQLDRPVGNPVSSDMRHMSQTPPFVWEDSNALLFLACDKGATGVYRALLESNQPKAQLNPVWDPVWHDAGRTVAALDKAGGKTVLQIGSPSETDDLYLLPQLSESFGTLIRLTDSNPWLRQVDLGTFQRFTCKGDKDWDIDGWLICPAGYEQGKKYPTVLFIHGGPHGVYGSSFMFQCQIFASKGYAVLYTNPRGSESYGQEFAYACVQDWGGSDFKDIMAGVDYVVNAGIADPSRLFVTGWSYGGYMTSWTITQTTRFKAAIAGAIVANRYSMYGTSDIPFFGEHHWGGLPWDVRDKYFERSAISYVTQVETPVMFIHGEGDLRCPISQSEELYLSLKRLGKTAVFIRYPGEFHGFTRPSHKFDRYERMIAWFDYYASL